MSRLEVVDSLMREQSVCVTGGRGSLGRRLVRRLADAGVSRTVVFDMQPLPIVEEPAPGVSVEHVVGSILNSKELEDAVAGCSVVFHLAALIRVGDSTRDPGAYFEANTMGTVRVLEACRRTDVKRVVYTSTGHVYGVPVDTPVSESHPTQPLSIYAASKLAGETAVQGFAAGYDFSCSIARLSNLYGASSTPETVIGRAMDQLLRGEPITLRNLTSVRDFLHEDDAAEALIRLAATGDGRGYRTVNVSTSQGETVLRMAETLSRIGAEEGLGHHEVVQPTGENEETLQSLVLDNRKLAATVGWTPGISLEEGLRRSLREAVQMQHKAALRR